MYPDADKEISNVTTLEGLRETVKHISVYRDMLREVPDPLKREEFSADVRGLDDLMYEEEVKKYSLAFEE